MNNILRIGLTGGIASGKSTVCEMFNDLGVPIVDADQIVHELIRPGQTALKRIIDKFGDKYLTKEGLLDRKLLRKDIFNNKKLKDELEEILHPLVYAEIDNKVTLLNAPYCVISIPLLIETNALDKVDRVLVVDIPDALQIDRASKRDGVDISEITKILNAQVKRKKRLDIADDIIKNDGDIDNLRIQVENLHKIYLAMANDNLATLIK